MSSIPSKTGSSESIDRVPSVYDLVVQATQSGIHITEDETDILNSNKQGDSKNIVDEESGTTHRIDSFHELTGESNVATRLRKFIELTKRYSKGSATTDANSPVANPQTDSPQTDSPQTDSPQTDSPQTELQQSSTSKPKTSPPKYKWTNQSRNRAVGYRLQSSVVVPPEFESTIGPQRIDRPDTEQTIVPPHFDIAPSATPAPVLQPEETAVPAKNRTEPQTRRSESLMWEVESFLWPKVTNELISESSLAIDKLGNNIFKLLTGDQNQLLLTSSLPREGVTTISISLARWAASLGHQVLLVDGNIGNAGLTDAIGLNQEISWTSAADNPARIGDSIVHGKNSGVFVMPLAAVRSRANLPSNLYASLAKILGKISDCFDLILIDAGPSKQLFNETSHIDDFVDATLMVQDISRSLGDDFSIAKSKLLSCGVAKMIIAENFTRTI